MQVSRLERVKMRIERLDVAEIEFFAHHRRKILELHARLGAIAIAIVRTVDEGAKRIGSYSQTRARLGGKVQIGLFCGEAAGSRRPESELYKRATVHQ